MSETPEVLTQVEDGVLIVTMNRPEAKNAMNKAQAEGISAAMDRLETDNDLRCAILTGAGGTFCSGMDLKGFLRGDRGIRAGRGKPLGPARCRPRHAAQRQPNQPAKRQPDDDAQSGLRHTHAPHA